MSVKIDKEFLFIKIILIILLLLAIGKMPYWYYQLIKIVLFVSFGYLAFIEYKNNIKLFPFLFLIFCVIFAPVLSFRLGRTGWNIVDIIAAGVLIYSIIDAKYFRRFYE